MEQELLSDFAGEVSEPQYQSVLGCSHALRLNVAQEQQQIGWRQQTAEEKSFIFNICYLFLSLARFVTHWK